MAYKTRKKKVKKNVPEGIAHVHSTFNNTITTITDKDGNVVSWASSGAIGFKGSKINKKITRKVSKDAINQVTIETQLNLNSDILASHICVSF